MTPSPCVPLPAGKGEEKKEVLAHLLRTPFEKWIQKEALFTRLFSFMLSNTNPEAGQALDH
jgi:hypothetical protein